MKKLKKSFKKRFTYIKQKKEHYFEYNKIYSDFLSYEAFRLKIDLESFILRNYNENLQLTYLQDVIRDFSLEKKSVSNIIKVDKNYRIIANHERVIEAVKNNEAEVEIDIVLGGRLNKGVPIATLDAKKLKIFESIMEETKHIYTGIIWEPTFNFLENIIKEIKKVYQVIKVLEIEFENTQEFIDYLNKVYECNTRKDFVQTKINRLIKGKNKAVMVYYDVGDPKIDKSGTAQEQVQGLKNHIRRTFRNRMDNYIFDICYHSGVNHKEVKDIEDALKIALKNSKNTIRVLENFSDNHWKNLN